MRVRSDKETNANSLAVILRRTSFFQNIVIFYGLFFTLPATAAHSQDVVLSWVRPHDLRVSGYIIFYGLADTDFKSDPAEIIHSPEQTSCKMFGLIGGQTYGFAAKSFDRSGNESVFSEVIHYDVPDAQEKDSSHGGGGGCFINIFVCDEKVSNLQ